MSVNRNDTIPEGGWGTRRDAIDTPAQSDARTTWNPRTFRPIVNGYVSRSADRWDGCREVDRHDEQAPRTRWVPAPVAAPGVEDLPPSAFSIGEELFPAWSGGIRHG